MTTESLKLQTAQKYQQALYLYEENIILNQIQKLKTDFPNVDFLYSIKTNPFPPIVNCIAHNQLGADAASAYEVQIALDSGIKPQNIYYSAPGKTQQDIEKTLSYCTIIADSYTELQTIQAIAKAKNIKAWVGLRINPAFNMVGNQRGSSSKFGVDEESLIQQQAFLNTLTHIKITGIHTHLKSQILDVSTLAHYYENVFRLAQFCQEALGWNISFINFGGGLGIPYSTQKDKELNTNHLGANFHSLKQKYQIPNARLLIESGRFIIGQAGTFITPIIDIKTSRGTKYLIVSNALNGFMRPSIAALLAQLGTDLGQFSAEPLFTAPDAFDISILGKTGVQERVTVAGNLCTATDLLGENLLLPKAEIGDFISVSKAGSYAYTLSPLLFSGHSLPLQIFLRKNGQASEEVILRQA